MGSQNPSGTEPLLLRVSDAAERLAISRSQCYSLVNEGALPAVRIGQSLRIPREALLRLIESTTVGGHVASTQAR